MMTEKAAKAVIIYDYDNIQIEQQQYGRFRRRL